MWSILLIQCKYSTYFLTLTLEKITAIDIIIFVLDKRYILIHSSSVVELSAVNRSVVGSSPTCGAIWKRTQVG